MKKYINKLDLKNMKNLVEDFYSSYHFIDKTNLENSFIDNFQKLISQEQLLANAKLDYFISPAKWYASSNLFKTTQCSPITLKLSIDFYESKGILGRWFHRNFIDRKILEKETLYFYFQVRELIKLYEGVQALNKKSFFETVVCTNAGDPGFQQQHQLNITYPVNDSNFVPIFTR